MHNAYAEYESLTRPPRRRGQSGRPCVGGEKLIFEDHCVLIPTRKHKYLHFTERKFGLFPVAQYETTKVLGQRCFLSVAPIVIRHFESGGSKVLQPKITQVLSEAKNQDYGSNTRNLSQNETLFLKTDQEISNQKEVKND